MKKKDFLKLLENIPDEAEITIVRGDDILGDYEYETLLNVREVDGRKLGSSIYTTYSNYGYHKDTKNVKLWVIE